MTKTPSFRQELVSQIPALRLLMTLGGEYLPPDEALAVRGVECRCRTRCEPCSSSRDPFRHRPAQGLAPRDVQRMYPTIKAR